MEASKTTLTDSQQRFVERLIENVVMSRSQLINRLMDPRRNIDDECGYPPDITSIGIDQYRDLYDREPVANRVVQLLPRECWQVQPLVYEDEDSQKPTEFEDAWDALGRGLRGEQCWYQDEAGSPVWEHLRRADVLSGIGHYGVLLLGFDDGKALDQPVDGVSQTAEANFGTLQGTDAQYAGIRLGPAEFPSDKPSTQKRKLLFLRAYDESLVQITQYEADLRSPRFGMPVFYLLTINDPREQQSGIGLPVARVKVHWTRLIHLADNLNSSEVMGTPRMRPVLNRLLDLRKVYGASAEGFWKSCFTGLSLETHPELGGDAIIDQLGMKSMMENYQNGLQRYLTLVGMSAKSLAPSVVDPASQISTQIEAICIQLGCPVRVFKGSERGELASSQDDASWNDRLRERQNNYITPRVIVPFIDRLISAGVLPEPQGYSVEWPDLDSLGDADKAAIGLQRTQALVAYVTGGVENLITPEDYLTRVMGLDEEEAEAITDASRKANDDEKLTVQPPVPPPMPGMGAAPKPFPAPPQPGKQPPKQQEKNRA